MEIKEGDRFLNTKTGTVIWVEEIMEIGFTVFIDHTNPDGHQYYNTHVKLKNLTDGSKTKTLELSWFKEILKIGIDYIIPYKAEKIKPIKFLKQHKLCQQLN